MGSLRMVSRSTRKELKMTTTTRMRYKGTLYKLATPTAAEDAAFKIHSELIAAGYSDKACTFTVRKGISLVGEDSLMIVFYSRPMGTRGADLENSEHSCKISIEAGREWKKDGPAPDKVVVKQFTNWKCPKLRAKTGPLPKIIDYVISYFKTNAKEMLG